MGTPDHQLSLALDLGNSAGKAGLFRGKDIEEPVLRFSYDEWRLVDEWVTNRGVKNIVYSSVANVPPPELVDNWKQAGVSVLSLKPGSPLPFASLYATPETLGQDRIAAVMGLKLWATIPTNPAPATSPYLIVDAGTCVTMDLVGADGLHHGGNISPGLRMRLRAMHEFTARLPQPEPGQPAGEVGLSTVAALQHGGGRGLVYELEGLYARLLPKHPGLHVLLTGGDGAWLADQLQLPCSYDPYLVLRGLLQILSTYETTES